MQSYDYAHNTPNKYLKKLKGMLNVINIFHVLRRLLQERIIFA